MDARAEIHLIQSNMNEPNLTLMQSVEAAKHCRKSNVADEISCPSPTSIEKMPIRSEKWYMYVPMVSKKVSSR